MCAFCGPYLLGPFLTSLFSNFVVPKTNYVKQKIQEGFFKIFDFKEVCLYFFLAEYRIRAKTKA